MTAFRVLRPVAASVRISPLPPRRIFSSFSTPASVPFSTMATEQPTKRTQNHVLFVCDLQEKFRNAISGFDKIVLTTTKVLRAAQVLSIPVFVTTQNRARLGDIVPEVRAHLPAALVKEDADKTLFSMWIPAVSRHLDDGVPRIVTIVGIEAHICVTQTALDLLAAGHQVRVLADGVSSCNREEVAVALARLRAEGAVVTTSESWMYECMGDAAIPEFKAVVGLVKDTSADTRTVLQNLLPAKM